MMKIFKRLSWLLWDYVFGQALFTVKLVEDFPPKLKRQYVYVTGTLENPWQIAFICPCGCKEVIELYADQDTEPHWDLIIDKKNKVTLKPSVWRTRSCRSHFFLRQGRIEWVPE